MSTGSTSGQPEHSGGAAELDPPAAPAAQAAQDPRFERRRLRWRYSRGKRRDLKASVFKWLALPAIVLVFFGFALAQTGAPRELWLIVVGFALVVFVFTGGRTIRAMLFRRRLAASAQAHPDDPVMHDFPWQREGTGDNTLTRAWVRLSIGAPVTAVAGALLGVALVMPYSGSDAVRFGWMVAATVATAGGLVVLGQGVYLALQRVLYGRIRLRFERFPFHPGQMVEVRWMCPQLTGLRRLKFTLRCIEEEVEVHYVHTKNGRRRRERFNIYELFTDTYDVDNPGRLDPVEGVPVTFLLPANAPPTVLNRRAPRYWELEVRAERPLLSLTSRYLVPVYSAASSEPAAESASIPD